MSAANVRNIQVLADMKAALARFKSDAQAQLLATQQEIRRAQEWLAERERHWQRQVQQCQEIARRAQAALAHCQASGFRDEQGRYYPPNCSAEERIAAQAERQLENARRELETVQHAARAVAQAAAEFQREQQRLSNLLNNDLAKASALLENKIGILQSYIALGAPSASYSAPNRGTAADSGVAFEQWASANVFHNKQRIRVPIVLNQHLQQFDEEGLGLLQDRVSDNYVDVDGSLWDAKAYDENSVIDREQLRDYQLMERAGYVIDAEGNRTPVTSVNYLFRSRAAAERNVDYLRGEATVWYVDDSGAVRLYEEQ